MHDSSKPTLGLRSCAMTKSLQVAWRLFHTTAQYQSLVFFPPDTAKLASVENAHQHDENQKHLIALSNVVYLVTWRCILCQATAPNYEPDGVLPECIEGSQQVALCPECESLPFLSCLLCLVPHGIECCRHPLIHQLQQASLQLQESHCRLATDSITLLAPQWLCYDQAANGE